MQHEIDQISRQIQELENTQIENIGISETRHRELMDYMLTLKIESDKRHESVKHLLYIILIVLIYIGFKL